jgi:Ca2+:H+ antiporter
LSASDIQRVVDTARSAAAVAGHAFVGTEHLLAALLVHEGGPAAHASLAAGMEPQGLIDELVSGLKAAEAGAEGPPPLSGFAERAIQDAERLAKDGRDAEVALLDALMRSPRGRIASILSRRGVKPSALRSDTPPEAPAAKPAKTQPKAERPPRAPNEKPPRERTRSDRSEAGAPAGRGPKPSSPAPEIKLPEPDRPPQLPPHLRKKPRKFRWSLLLLVMIPISVVLNATDGPPIWTFVTACLGVLPLAGLMGTATEQLSERTGPTIGGLLNATFGNAAELIIAIVALRAGLVDLVKASITGSILGNLLLILGLSLIAAGTKSPTFRFNRTSAGMSAAMLALAVVGLVFPAIFHGLHPETGEAARLALTELRLSEAVAVILAITYGGSLLFSLWTHKTLFGGDPRTTPHGPIWSVGRAVLVLAVATAGVVLESEILVHAVEGVTAGLGLSEMFLGLIIIPIIGNAAEHATAVLVARKGQTDLALQIALGSSTQIALLVAPLLVLAGVILGQPMNLVFTPFEVAAVAMSTVVVSIITLDGESHWFEGVQLLAVYGMVAAAAFFL